MAASVVAGAKGITVAPGASGSPLTLGTATATVRQVPATVVTTQTVRELFTFCVYYDVYFKEITGGG